MQKGENQIASLFNRIQIADAFNRDQKEQMPAVKRDLFTARKKVAEKIAPFPRQTPAVKGSNNIERVNQHPAASSGWLYRRARSPS